MRPPRSGPPDRGASGTIDLRRKEKMSADVGDPAPTFTLADETGAEVSSAELYRKPTVIFFYPAAMTPGCTAEACDFRDRYETLQDAGYQVVGISPDPPERNAKFKTKERLLPAAVGPGPCGGRRLRCVGYQEPLREEVRGTHPLDVPGGDGNLDRAWRNVKAKGHVAKVAADLLGN